MLRLPAGRGVSDAPNAVHSSDTWLSRPRYREGKL